MSPARTPTTAGNGELLLGRELYTEVIEGVVLHAERTIWIATANLKDMHVRKAKGYAPILSRFDELAVKGVRLRVIHADLPSRPFRATLEKYERLTGGALELQVCPRSHWKMIIVDGAAAYLGSANLTGAGLGARREERRNLELGLLSRDPAIVGRLAAEFDRFWIGDHCPACAFRERCPDPIR